MTHPLSHHKKNKGKILTCLGADVVPCMVSWGVVALCHVAVALAPLASALWHQKLTKLKNLTTWVQRVCSGDSSGVGVVALCHVAVALARLRLLPCSQGGQR